MTLIIIYMGICLLILAFIVLFALTVRFQRNIQTKMTLELRNTLEALPLDDLTKPEWQIVLSQLKGRGKRSDYLYCYDRALEEVAHNKKWAESYFPSAEETYYHLARYYMYVYTLERTYFVQHISKYAEYFSDKRVFETLLMYTNRRNVLERENILQALYKFGDASLIREALHKIATDQQFHHSKLIMDGLLKVKQPDDGLTELLWEDFDDFPHYIQVGIVKYMQQTTPLFREKFYRYLQADQGDLEVRLSMIRYFQKYPYDKCYPILLSMLENKDELPVEYRIVSAYTLSGYPGDKTVQALKEALTDCNWYVRVNASRSLLNLNVPIAELEEVLAGDDQFAKEILTYYLTEKERQLYE